MRGEWVGPEHTNLIVVENVIPMRKRGMPFSQLCTQMQKEARSGDVPQWEGFTSLQAGIKPQEALSPPVALWWKVPG